MNDYTIYQQGKDKVLDVPSSVFASEEAQKLYAVTAGEYSDYHIVAITSDKNKAEQIKETYIKRYRWYSDEINIEEYADGYLALGQGWRVCLDKKTGNVLKVDKDMSESFFSRMTCSSSGGEAIMCAYVMADTEERAIKIAAELRARWLAAEYAIT